jgi:polyketide cyclase/dehydrase/lipid transport protein
MQIKRMIIAPRLRSNATPMHEIQSQIEIAAPRERVWSILADFPSYPSWNPFIRSIDGPAAAGRVSFTQGEKFSGLIVGLAKASLDRGTKAGFVAMNAALKSRAENGSTL